MIRRSGDNINQSRSVTGRDQVGKQEIHGNTSITINIGNQVSQSNYEALFEQIFRVRKNATDAGLRMPYNETDRRNLTDNLQDALAGQDIPDAQQFSLAAREHIQAGLDAASGVSPITEPDLARAWQAALRKTIVEHDYKLIDVVKNMFRDDAIFLGKIEQNTFVGSSFGIRFIQLGIAERRLLGHRPTKRSLLIVLVIFLMILPFYTIVELPTLQSTIVNIINRYAITYDDNINGINGNTSELALQLLQIVKWSMSSLWLFYLYIFLSKHSDNIISYELNEYGKYLRNKIRNTDENSSHETMTDTDNHSNKK